MSLTERNRSRSISTSAARSPLRSAWSRAVQVRSSSHWRLGSPVSGSRNCSSARARAIHSVESSAISGTANSGSSTGRPTGHHHDQRGDAQQRDADQALAHQRGAGHGRQAAAARGDGVPQQGAGGGEVAQRDGDQHGHRDVAPGVGPPGVLDRGVVPAQREDQAGGADAEDVHAAVQQCLPPAVAPGGADQQHHGQADQDGGHPAVQQQYGEGQRGAGAGAAPPAVAAERDQVADDDAGQYGEGPAGRAAGEQRAPPGHHPGDARQQRQCRGGHDCCAQHRRGHRRYAGPPPPWQRSGLVRRFHARPSHSRVALGR